MTDAAEQEIRRLEEALRNIQKLAGERQMREAPDGGWMVAKAIRNEARAALTHSTPPST